MRAMSVGDYWIPSTQRSLQNIERFRENFYIPMAAGRRYLSVRRFGIGRGRIIQSYHRSDDDYEQLCV
jgi:hypothetical protein